MTYKLKVDVSKLQEYAKEKQAALADVVRKHALILQANTIGSPTMPVDTGALKNSIKAKSVTRFLWRVSDGVSYGIFQELGTSRGVPARHFLGGAVEKTAQGFFDDAAKAMK